ncbi:hypothetical protein F2P81_009991 [Scophthalmus maximus]|uniref:Uncharacterized protein n=1 Tax=Scophthalmus maximus TaxID=52904 RepID=A0A6A4SUI1_SCOMX|nr:hypothetical protein F2P81_009991 [Scophthalmus maximus]
MESGTAQERERSPPANRTGAAFTNRSSTPTVERVCKYSLLSQDCFLNAASVDRPQFHVVTPGNWRLGSSIRSVYGQRIAAMEDGPNEFDERLSRAEASPKLRWLKRTTLRGRRWRTWKNCTGRQNRRIAGISENAKGPRLLIDVYYIDDKECAQMYGRVWGTYELRRPMLAVMEPDMLRSILVKECFNYFTNRRDLRLNGDLYDIVSIAEDDQWRRIRNIFTPNFTSGRIKEMFGIMKHHSRKLIDKLRPKVDNNEVVEVKRTVVEKVRAERNESSPQGSVQYEALMQMEYLDAVVNESLRLYPPIARIDRVAKETIKIKDITILKDMVVLVPVYALHHDPELWPEPEEFKPERFSKENKQSITPYTYLPFGVGPRNCLGMRFALVILKLGLVEVLQNYSFSICEETEVICIPFFAQYDT